MNNRVINLTLCHLLGNGPYRGYSAVAVQAEIRQRSIGRLGGVTFLSAGDIKQALSQFSPAECKVDGGGGLRFFISLREHLNVRLDAALSKQIHGVYVNISEAF